MANKIVKILNKIFSLRNFGIAVAIMGLIYSIIGLYDLTKYTFIGATEGVGDRQIIPCYDRYSNEIQGAECLGDGENITKMEWGGAQMAVGVFFFLFGLVLSQHDFTFLGEEE